MQFNQVTGAGNHINCKVAENRPGESYTEDVISIYKSFGASPDPIQIMSNKLKGGGLSSSGTGMLPTDHGSSYVLLKDNIFVDPGTIGTAISSGHHIQIVNNLIYAKKQPFTWTGISIRNQLKSQGYVCYGHTVSGNLINWTSKGGKPNPYRNDGTCGTVTDWTLISGMRSSGLRFGTLEDQPVPACELL